MENIFPSLPKPGFPGGNLVPLGGSAIILAKISSSERTACNFDITR
jgi:hypothetical protein